MIVLDLIEDQKENSKKVIFECQTNHFRAKNTWKERKVADKRRIIEKLDESKRVNA